MKNHSFHKDLELSLHSPLFYNHRMVCINCSLKKVVRTIVCALILAFVVSTSVSAQCLELCQLNLGSSEGIISLSGDITNDNGNEMSSTSVDVLDGTATCTGASDGTDDFTFNFTTEEYFDVYGGNTIATPAGSTTRDITNTSTGLQGTNVTGTNGSTTNTSTGDVSCYNIEVLFTEPEQAQFVDVEMTSINTRGRSFESASVIFLDASGMPYGSASYNGFWDGTPMGSGTGTNTKNVNTEADI